MHSLNSFFVISLALFSSSVLASPYPDRNGVPYKTITKTVTKTKTSTHTYSHIFTAYATITDTSNCPFTTPTDSPIVVDAPESHIVDLRKRETDADADARSYANPDALPDSLPDEFNDMLAAAPAEILEGRQRRAFEQRGATAAAAAVKAPGSNYFHDTAAGRTKIVTATETAVAIATVNRSYTTTLTSVVSGCPVVE